MILCMIAALSENYVIGKDNKLPRHYPEDLKRFKDMTLDSPIVMWRNTFLSIGKALPNRRNIVLTRGETYPDVEIFHDPELILEVLEDELDAHDQVFIIGGESLYRYYLPHAEYLYLTEIKKTYEWDTFFPECQEEFEAIERVEYPEFDFVTYRKKRIA